MTFLGVAWFLARGHTATWKLLVGVLHELEVSDPKHLVAFCSFVCQQVTEMH